MPDQPWPITAKNVEELIQQTTLLFDELFEERIGGAELGDVFGVGDDDILALALAPDPGLEKVANQLRVKIKSAGGITRDSDGLSVAFSLPYVKVSHVLAVGNHAGGFTLGAWRTRPINTEDSDASNLCSIAANQITLAAGTYKCYITCPAVLVDEHQARLYNITDGAAILLGNNQYSGSAGGEIVVTCSIITGLFTLASQKVLEVQHRCAATRAADGMGVACTFGDEVYAIAEFWKTG